MMISTFGFCAESAPAICASGIAKNAIATMNTLFLDKLNSQGTQVQTKSNSPI